MTRWEYTERSIRKALDQMLKDGLQDKVTVTKLCQIADINRATFYQHHSSIEELYEKVVEDFYLEIVFDAKLILAEQGSSAEAVRQIVLLSLKKYATVPEYYPILTRMNQDKMHRYIYSQYVPKAQDTPYFRMQMDFAISGGDGVCSQWMAKGCVTPVDEIADAVASLIFKCFSEP